MKQIRFDHPGEPARVARCVEVADPGSLAPDQVRVQVAAFPLNQADLLGLRGSYARAGAGPATLGQEAVGRVVALGSAVERIRPGDTVILLGQQCWSEYRQVHWSQVLPVPDSIDLLQLAMLKVNPATAMLLLERFVELAPGDWIICNAANSAVGRSLLQLASMRGVRTVAVARREEVLDSLREHGADLALKDGADLGRLVGAGTGQAAIRLGADAVGGTGSERMLDCLSDGAALVCYGGLEGQPCRIGVRDLVFRDVHVHGFWLTRFLANAAYGSLVGLYGGLCRDMDAGRLRLPVEAVYPIEAIGDALEHAGRPCNGKVLVTTDAFAAMRATRDASAAGGAGRAVDAGSGLPA